MSEHYILEGKEAKSVDLMTWAKWFENFENRRVDQTIINPEIRVSTVFLGLDHSFGDGPPLLFETMIFDGEDDEYQERYSTWDEAEKGHEKAVAVAKKRVTGEIK